MNDQSITYSEKDRKWVEAIPVPYYPSIVDKIRCFLGKHTYMYDDVYENKNIPHGVPQCLVCGKYKKNLHPTK
jgi:hypothetical protein